MILRGELIKLSS